MSLFGWTSFRIAVPSRAGLLISCALLLVVKYGALEGARWGSRTSCADPLALPSLPKSPLDSSAIQFSNVNVRSIQLRRRKDERYICSFTTEEYIIEKLNCQVSSLKCVVITKEQRRLRSS